MCQKSSKIFKQLYAVILTSNTYVAPKALQVFKNKPTADEINRIISTQVIGKIEPTPYIYSEKPKIDIVQIDIPIHIFYN